MKYLPLITMLAIVLLFCQCDDEEVVHDHDPYQEEACEHLANGPSEDVSASVASGGTVPEISHSHTRYDITLNDDGGSYSGYVKLVADEAVEHHLFFDSNVSFKLLDLSLNELSAAETTTSFDDCNEIGLMNAYDLSVDSYLLHFDSNANVDIQLVVLTEDEVSEGHNH